MKTIYYYLFYRIYSLWKKMPGRDHAFLAMVALSLLILYNFITIIGYLNFINSSNINKYKTPLIVFAILVIAINYFIFIFKNKYVTIEAEFINESEKQKFISSIVVLIYVFLTFVFLFWVLFFNKR